jgi:hypothetical protein
MVGTGCQRVRLPDDPGFGGLSDEIRPAPVTTQDVEAIAYRSALRRDRYTSVLNICYGID